MFNVVISPRHSKVFNNGLPHLEHFPDEPIVVLEKEPEWRWLMVANDNTYLMRGDSIGRINKINKVLRKTNSETDFDRDYAGVSTIFRDGHNDLWGLYHGEKHEYEGEKISQRDWKIGLVKCNGKTFDRMGVVLQTCDRNNNYHHFGLGDPSVCKMRTGELYAYYTDLTRVSDNSENPGKCVISMAKCDPEDPLKWYKRSGNPENACFDVEGLEPDSPLVELFDNAPEDCDFSLPNVQYVEIWDIYIMTFVTLALNELNKNHRISLPDRSGFYISHSEDGLRWNKPIKLFTANVQDNGYKASMRPCFIVHSYNKYSIKGVLYYAYSKCLEEQGYTPHCMVQRSMHLHKHVAIF
ncbi:hypothetical protein [Gimesia sp.]|uniref:hypothetical protein n=1 Tax=Gimesia sp. TaxID=2024833 RepID=UPI003A9076D9